MPEVHVQVILLHATVPHWPVGRPYGRHGILCRGTLTQVRAYSVLSKHAIMKWPSVEVLITVINGAVSWSVWAQVGG